MFNFYLVSGSDNHECLLSTALWLSNLFFEKNLVLINAKDFLAQKIFEDNQANFFFTNFDLKNEISEHKNLSLKVNLDQAFNPYDKFSEIFDDKFLFHKFLSANNFKQPKTTCINTLDSPLPNWDFPCIVKPSCGTMAIDFKVFKEKFDIKHLRKILAYDKILLQEFIKVKLKFKALLVINNGARTIYFNDNLDQEIKNKAIEEIKKILLLCNFKKRIFSLDFLCDYNENLFLLKQIIDQLDLMID